MAKKKTSKIATENLFEDLQSTFIILSLQPYLSMGKMPLTSFCSSLCHKGASPVQQEYNKSLFQASEEDEPSSDSACHNEIMVQCQPENAGQFP